MAYVDLNPVRANMAITPGVSDHTLVKKRCEKAKNIQQLNSVNQQEKTVLPVVGNPKQDQPQGIQMRLTDYLNLVDCTGRVLRNKSRDDKRGHINASAEKILKRLNIEEGKWLQITSEFEQCFHSFVGSEINLRVACEQLNYQTPSGLTVCQRMFY
jgi:hypothetical protein